ncbi:glycosyltransferase family 2 protein [Blautia liquoris]|uniref:Glycosyltransferase family 2 protein n=1 Tax=Blautia liquoris TaxID=2779518 RepID=A0A7M2RFT5_9FIRM|nr:glycosyltransferase family 2 protein [Blautia liquoris]QOV19119.1 glycosyltransferase family 2 protein [Blautia liquoris]
MDKLCIIIPAYNEQANVEQVIKQWYPVAVAHAGEIVVIDDGSTDLTYEILRSQEKKLPHLTVLTKKNNGHGATVLYGYHYAIKNHADYIFQTDSDGQTLPEEFEEFWKNREHFDMVIGYRKGRHDGCLRVFVTKVLRAVIWLCFCVYVRDANTPYRLIRGQTLRRYIDLIPPGFHLANVLISVIFVKKGCKVKWLPITFRPRQGGKNSMNGKKIVKIGCSAVRDFWKINRLL